MLDKTKIYEDYHSKVLGYVVNQINDFHMAEDLTSDIFVKVYEKIDTFDESKASISTWIFTITRNKLIDYYRTRKVMVEVPETLTYEEDDDGILTDEALDKLAVALENINDRDRKIIVEHYYQNKTLKEIAEDMGLSYVYVKILHQKALFKLKNYIQ